VTRVGNERILANDFGPHHGFTLFERGKITCWEKEYGQNGHLQLYRDLSNLMEPKTIFIGERFLHLHEFANRPKIDLTTPEYIGVAKTYLQLTGRDDFAVWQNASMACGETAFWGDNNKAGAGNEKIKKLNLWQPGKRHAMDSLRHLLYYISFTMHDDYYLTLLKDFRSKA
jgi:hypothetical protein